MVTRFILVLLAGWCVTMNVKVWQLEYGSRANAFPVPEALIWRKILSAPEASSLNLFEAGKRAGFCEIATRVQQEMSQLDEDNPPPDGFLNPAGYQLHITGNASLGEFTNRIKFDGQLEFAPNRAWRHFECRLMARGLTVELASTATNQTLHLGVIRDDERVQRTLTFAELKDPNRVLGVLAGDLAGLPAGWLAGLELPAWGGMPAAGSPIQWTATRSRLLVNHESVPVYRLETRVLDRPVVIIASILGEILRVELPGDYVASLDE